MGPVDLIQLRLQNDFYQTFLQITFEFGLGQEVQIGIQKSLLEFETILKLYHSNSRGNSGLLQGNSQ
jgi:hypothetical protein